MHELRTKQREVTRDQLYIAFAAAENMEKDLKEEKKKSSERFLRTHGQSILNAEKRWPNAAELVMNDSRPFSASVKLKTD